METTEVIVIGAGVIGLAVARALAIAGREVVVVEAAEAIGTETSSRNSEVIHAGIYYPAGSLKAQLCVRGNRMMYDYCAAHGVAARRCGKLIVATDARQLPDLEQIQAAALRNGVDGIERLGADAARALEPQLRCAGALLSPSTGIVDSHGLMLALRGDAEAHGAMIAFGSPVTGGKVGKHGGDGGGDGGGKLGVELDIGGRAPLRIAADIVVNCAGLHAPAFAALLAGFPRERIPRAYFCKGNYYSLAARAPFSHLVYPVPEGAGLGVHLTLDLAGQARFGPDVEWVDQIEYSVDPRRADRFYAAIRAYWPALRDGALQPAYAGIRPKVSGPGEAPADFMIEGPRDHGVAGVIHLYGIESPGLTASLAIAEYVRDLVASK